MTGDKAILFYPKTDSANLVRFIPLSLLKIGSQLKDAGYEVIVIDERFDLDYQDRLEPLLNQALFFGASVMTGYQIKGALSASAFVKRMNSAIPVVWGGWHPSILPEETLANKYVDIVVRNQGEITVVELANALANGKGLGEISGISFRQNGKLVSNKSRAFEDINTFAPVRLDVLDIGRYITETPLGDRTIFWNSSQGCPYPCGFCCTPAVYCRKWSGLKSDRLLSELKTLVNIHNVNAVIFAEDNFLVDVKRVEEFSRGLIDNRLAVKWATDVRIDKVNQFSDEFLNLLARSGCTKFYVGAESGDEDVLSLIDKRIHLDDTFKMAEKLAKHKIISEFFLMVGFPTNPVKDLENTLELIREVKMLYPDHQFTAFLYTPYPGTPLMELSLKHGLRIPSRLEDWTDWNVLSVNTPWVDERYLDRVNMFTKYYYPIAFPSASLQSKFRKRVKGIAYRILHRIACFRIRNNYFKFPVEWKLLKWFHLLQTKYGLFRNVESFR